jgi:hypothetical protein
MANQHQHSSESAKTQWSGVSEPKPKLDEHAFLLFLGGVAERLQQAEGDPGGASPALDELFLALRAHKLRLSEVDWERLVGCCRRHPLLSLLHRDPFTLRGFQKPRGYAGDACMMDLIYGPEEHWPPPVEEPIGRLVFEHAVGGPACQGVRSRRALIASVIDRLAEQRPHPHILSIAAGHLREANLSAAVRRQRIGRLVALDADAQSLAEVRACYGKFGVETVTASFRHLLTSTTWHRQFDLVYSTGLFDYLAQRSGRRLLLAMHQMLRPGGSLLVANFLPGVHDTGYMEAFMDWKLIYRSRQEMVDLTSDIEEAEIAGVELWSEEARNIIFLRVTRS